METMDQRPQHTQQPSQFFFDKEDHALLAMVREARVTMKKGQGLFSADLHPNGLKQMAAPWEMRIAYTVINLLNSLEKGQATDRLQALATLYDEVVAVGSAYRLNTGRALIQIMKELVRHEGTPEQELMLAHNFRKAAAGNRRLVRSLLSDYHLLEMPESWNQLTFDDHVHDSLTKGRKTPTHLIMDAWIKGIRTITVIYYNYLDRDAAEELIQAASIMGVETRIGIDCPAIFRGRQISLIWEPKDIDDLQGLHDFFDEKPVARFMEEGREASQYHSGLILKVLEAYNNRDRHSIGDHCGASLQPISTEDFLGFVGIGQPSLLHLSELVCNQLTATMATAFTFLREQYSLDEDPQVRKEIEDRVAFMRTVTPSLIRKKWLVPCLRSLPPSDKAPVFLQTPAADLLRRLRRLHRRSNITLSLSGLKTADVVELLFAGQGRISHLELYNLKFDLMDQVTDYQEINDLQFAINQGSAIALKRLIGDVLARYRASEAEDRIDRCASLTAILYSIQRLQSFYRRASLGTRMGSDSTGRANTLHGMGFAYVETLPPKARRHIATDQKSLRKIIPIRATLESVCTYTPLANSRGLSAWLRTNISLFRHLGCSRKHSWRVRPDSIRYTPDKGQITTLGGIRNQTISRFSLKEAEVASKRPGLRYLNTRTANTIKVSVGFVLALSSFLITQNWWFLALFGAPIWFMITGVRNIFQAVLAGGGLRNASLLRWKDYVNWSRISDSLLFTGISVPLLELTLRWWLLGQVFSITSTSNPVIFFTVVSTANGLYIASHNILRGLQKEAVIGNLFRSALAIPLALVYNSILVGLFMALSLEEALPTLAAASAIISKASSDTVAGFIEGMADRRTNMQMRHWDYRSKLRRFFACFASLQLLLPEEDVYLMLSDPKRMFSNQSGNINDLEKSLLIHSLDLMYFFMYQPRGRTKMEDMLRRMTPEERLIFIQAQGMLRRTRAVSQLFVDGIVGKNFSGALAFFLSQRDGYLRYLEHYLPQQEVQATL